MKATTIKENKEFKTLYYRGKSMSDSALVTYSRKLKFGGVKYGITTSKKIGNAVTRNRARRVIRAAFSELEGEISGSWQFVFVARTKTSYLKSYDVKKVMRNQLVKLGAISEENIDEN